MREASPSQTLYQEKRTPRFSALSWRCCLIRRFYSPLLSPRINGSGAISGVSISARKQAIRDQIAAAMLAMALLTRSPARSVTEAGDTVVSLLYQRCSPSAAGRYRRCCGARWSSLGKPDRGGDDLSQKRSSQLSGCLVEHVHRAGNAIWRDERTSAASTGQFISWHTAHCVPPAWLVHTC